MTTVLTTEVNSSTLYLAVPYSRDFAYSSALYISAASGEKEVFLAVSLRKSSKRPAAKSSKTKVTIPSNSSSEVFMIFLTV